MKDCFSSYHPIINMLYFVLVLVFAMFFMHPVCLVISFVCAFIYSVYLNGKKALRFNALFILPMLIMTAFLNPLFNHEGQTILKYMHNGNPLTLESIIYGAAAALMLVTVISWFSCFNVVMTADKFVYLLGRIIPALSLILSMSLRFVPRFKAQAKIIANAQRCIGRDISCGGFFRRARQGIKIISILVTWALENAIETADSMKGRGYGLPGRTAFSIFCFDRRDQAALLCILLCSSYLVIGSLAGGLYFRYFPSIQGVGMTLYSTSLYIVYALFCLMPVLINSRENLKWKAIKSKI